MGRRSFGSAAFERFSPVLWWSKAYPDRWYVGGDYYEDGHRARPRPKRSSVAEKVGTKRVSTGYVSAATNRLGARSVSRSQTPPNVPSTVVLLQGLCQRNQRTNATPSKMSPAPMIRPSVIGLGPPREIIVMCRLFRPCCKWPS